MKLNLHIKNFGRIKEANIAINNLTVFGGTNNTGKSYVSRALYAIFDVMNTNQTEEYFKSLLSNIDDAANELFLYMRFRSNSSEVSKNELGAIETPHKLRESTFDLQEKLLNNGVNAEFREMASSMIASTKELMSLLNKFNDESKTPLGKRRHISRVRNITYIMKIITKALKEFENAINESDAVILEKGYRETLKYNFLHNFQIESLSELIGEKQSSPAEITIKSENNVKLIEVSISHAEELKLKIPNEDSSKYLEEFSRVVYLESPMYWKLERPLLRVSASRMRRFVSDLPKAILSGVPKYFIDTHNAMTVRRTEKPSIDIDLEKIIGGKIIRNEEDKLVFSETGAKVPISLTLTASGVIQLGMLEHLIKTRVIQKGSILFIDEPEAHLHPEWQEKIMELIYKLSEAGVRIIIATHSPVIMEWITVQAKEHPESKDNIALNSFKKDTKFNCINKSYEENMDEIIQDLTEPFSRLYMREL